MTKITYMKKSEYNRITAEKLRNKYMDKPPAGYSKADVKAMSDDSILDMDYFLHEDSFDFCEDSFPTKEPDEILCLIDDLPKDPEEEDIPW